MSSSSPRLFDLRRPRSSRRDSGKARRARRFDLRPEALEERITPNAALTVAQIRAAYGFNSIPSFGGAAADGSGQTIALVSPGNEPSVFSDLDLFDQAETLTSGSTETLYQQYGPAASFLTVYNQDGVNISGNIGTSGSNGVPPLTDDPLDIALDVQWTHAIAPGAKIDLIEANSSLPVDKLASVQTGADLPGVSVLADTLGNNESSDEAQYDTSVFDTPAGHIGVTFLACAGDAGAPSQPIAPGQPTQYPPASPNVIGVGGTQLTLNTSGGYGGETAWSFPTPSPLDNGSSFYSQTGSWTSQSGGFSGSYSTASAGSSASATWTSFSLEYEGWNNGTEVSATWTPSPTNATNATYSIYDGTAATGTLLTTITVDQTKAPIGTPDGNTQFQELGDFFPASGRLTVVLNASNANGRVVADAIGMAEGWAGAGGPSLYEPEPEYQEAVQQTGFRTVPDVAFNASEDSGMVTYLHGQPLYCWGSTPATPGWTGLFALVDQGRVAEGLPTYNSTESPQEALDALYSIPSSDFHQITTGYNGFSATAGYDMLTGLGSPIANLIVPDLVAYEPGEFVATTPPPTNVTAGTPFSVTFTLEDPASGQVTSYFNGNVTIALAKNPGGGSLGGTLTVKAVDGVATFSGLTLTKAGVGYEIQATGSQVSAGITQAFNVVAGSPSQLVLVAPPPSPVTAGATFGLTAEVEDSYGNPVGNSKGSVTLALTSGPTGSVVSGTLSVAEVDGIANFTNLSLNKVSAGDILTLSTTGLTGVSTGPIAVIVGPIAQLAVIQAPPNGATAGAGFNLEVGAEDAEGNLETTLGGFNVTIAAANGFGTLQGTTSALVSGGMASFTNLIEDQAGNLYLTLTGDGFTDTSSPSIVVSPATAAKLVIHTQPSATAFAGFPFPTQPVIYEEDRFGNLETGDRSTVVTAALATGSGPLQGTTMAVVSGGVATFTNLLGGTIGTITLGFSGPNLAGATSNNIVLSKPAATVTWSASRATAVYQQSITLTATVSAPVGGAVPTGSVTFLDGSTMLGTVTLNAKGQAIFSTSTLPVGTQSITAEYSGSPTYAAGSPSTASLYVGDLATSDYDGDGKSDLAVFDQTTATFTILSSSTGATRVQQFGDPAHVNIAVPGDYGGVGMDNIAIYDQTTATFAVLQPNGTVLIQQFGDPAHVNIPVSGDFDDNGKTNFAIFDQTTATFAILQPNGSVLIQPFGDPSHVNIPVAGDFDGDGKTNIAIYDQTTATFAVLEPNGSVRLQQLGNARDANLPIAADFDGDGKTDFAVYDETAGLMLAIESDGKTIDRYFGNSADVNIPISGDFDGEGYSDIAIYDATAGAFLVIFPDGGSEIVALGNNKHSNRPV